MFQRVLRNNERLLSIVSGLLLYVGLVMILVGVVALGYSIYFCGSNQWDSRLVAVPLKFIEIICKGCFMFIMSHFIRYILAQDIGTSFIIRNMVRFIGCYVVYVIAAAIITIMASYNFSPGFGSSLMISASLILSTLAKVLIWISLALVLRCVLPVINEFKTTV